MLTNEEALNKIFGLPENDTPDCNIVSASSTNDKPVECDKPETVYSKLSNIVCNSEVTLTKVQQLITLDSAPNPELVSSAASLLNALNETLKEFTKIHLNKIKFEQAKELELLKANAKRELIEFKIKESKKASAIDVPHDTIPYTQEDIVSTIIKNNIK